MKRLHCQTANDTRFAERLDLTIEQVRSGADYRRLLSIEGPPASGKTASVDHACERLGGLKVRAREIWKGPRQPLYDLAYILNGWHVEGRTPALYERVQEDIVEKRIAFIAIDEADYLDSGGRYDLLSLFRDLSDETGCPILFLSVGRLAARFLRPTPFTETITSRLAARIEFLPPSMKDATLLAELVEDVNLDPHLVGACLAASGGSLRALLSIYAEIERAARSAGVTGNLTLGKAEQLRAFAGLAPIAPATTARVMLSASEKMVRRRVA
jgi:AAA domain